MRYIRKYVDSLFYPITIGILAFLGWILKFNLPSAIIISVMAFMPLFGKDGRAYLSLIILSPMMVWSRLSFNNIDLSLIILASCAVLSLILFIIIKKPKFRFGRAAITLIPLYAIFIISLIIQLGIGTKMHTESLSFLIGLIAVLLLYLIFVPILYGDGIFSYFSHVLALLATFISIQVIVYYSHGNFLSVGERIDLGWIQSSTMASSILVISLPFLSLFLSKKKWWYLPSLAVILVAIYQLRTASGLICAILVIIPLIFMIFRNYKYCPYYVIASLSSFGIFLTILFITNDNFFNIMVDSIRYLSEFLKGNIQAHRIGVEQFLTRPIFGPSINILAGVLDVETGYIRLLDDTVVTTLVMGGSIGLVAYAAHLANVYTLNFQRRNPYRWFFFVFLISTELIGLIDNTIYNLFFNFIYLFIIASYEAENRDPDVSIEQNFFNGYIYQKRCRKFN